MVVRNPADSAKKFVTRAQNASADYQAGVAGAGERWRQGAEASEAAWAEGTQAAIAEGRFRRGVAKQGTANKYQDNAVKLGPERFRTGVANAQDTYARGVAPFVQAMQSATLSARGARGSVQNARRVQEQMDLMRRTRRESLGLAG